MVPLTLELEPSTLDPRQKDRHHTEKQREKTDKYIT